MACPFRSPHRISCASASSQHRLHRLLSTPRNVRRCSWFAPRATPETACRTLPAASRDPLDHLRRSLQRAQNVNHVQQLVVTPLLGDVVADLAGLEIRNNHLRRIGRVDETAIEFRHRQQFLSSDGLDHVGSSDRPSRARRRLFVHRHPFGEPARDAIFRHRQHVYVAHFVPHRAGPVEVPGGGRTGCPSRPRAERHTQRAQARHAHGAHREIFMIGIDLQLHRAFSFNCTSFRKSRWRAPSQVSKYGRSRSDSFL